MFEINAPDCSTEVIEQISINTATSEQLLGMPGIGEKRAAEICAKRKEGNFESFEDAKKRLGKHFTSIPDNTKQAFAFCE